MQLFTTAASVGQRTWFGVCTLEKTVRNSCPCRSCQIFFFDGIFSLSIRRQLLFELNLDIFSDTSVHLSRHEAPFGTFVLSINIGGGRASEADRSCTFRLMLTNQHSIFLCWSWMMPSTVQVDVQCVCHVFSIGFRNLVTNRSLQASWLVVTYVCSCSIVCTYICATILSPSLIVETFLKPFLRNLWSCHVL